MGKNMEIRLISFVVEISDLIKKLDSSFASVFLSNQLFRSAASTALNFAEAQSSESRKDFIHKSSIVLKELRETNVNLKIISGINICTDKVQLESALLECEQLISIFYKSIDTARKNARPGKI